MGCNIGSPRYVGLPTTLGSCTSADSRLHRRPGPERRVGPAVRCVKLLNIPGHGGTTTHGDVL